VIIQIEGQPNLYRCTDSGVAINLRDYCTLDKLFSFDRWELKDPIRPPAGEAWILKQWSVVMHPWPKVVPTTINIKLIVNGLILEDIPLLRIAEPLERKEDAVLREQIKDIEERLAQLESHPRHLVQEQTCIKWRLLNQNHHLRACIYANTPKGGDDFIVLREMTNTFELRLRGLRRPPVR